MKNKSRIIGAEINMKDNSASIRESKLSLDEDDQLLMQSGGGGRGGAGGGIGVGNNGLFNETGADSKGCLFLYFLNVSMFLFFFYLVINFLKVYYINIRKIFYLQYT